MEFDKASDGVFMVQYRADGVFCGVDVVGFAEGRIRIINDVYDDKPPPPLPGPMIEGNRTGSEISVRISCCSTRLGVRRDFADPVH